MMTGKPLFSIITVCLNAGDSLQKTVKSVFSQTYSNYEHIIKDGCSIDGSLSCLSSLTQIRIQINSDHGIYDAMNQALNNCEGKYVNFLNAGDTFYDEHVLQKVSEFAQKSGYPDIIYTDYFNESLKCKMEYPDNLSAFYLYRHYICHQAQFIKADVLRDLDGFNIKLKIIADVDFLLRALLQHGYNAEHCSILGISYDGGFSELPRNKQLHDREINKIRKNYFKGRRCIYEPLRRITFPNTRSWLIKKCLGHKIIINIYCKIAKLCR